jgi:hypothetical protein
MVRTYHRPRDPYTRLQCAYLLSGGADAFGSAASLFADGDPEEAAELAAGGDDGRDDDSMAEDRACIAQFDWSGNTHIAQRGWLESPECSDVAFVRTLFARSLLFAVFCCLRALLTHAGT